MKLGVSSYSFTKYIKESGCDYKTLCNLAKEIGYEGIEFINLNRLCIGPDADEMKAALEIKEHCAGIGLDIIAYTVNGNLLADDLEKEMAYLKGCADIAEALGTSVMRYDSAWGPRPSFRYSYKDAIAEMAPNIRKIADYAGSKGIKTCIENHGRFFQAPDRVKELIDAVNHPNYGWLIDMGNFMGVDADVLEAVRIAAPYCFHLHAKDNLFKPGTAVAPDGWRSTQGGNFTRSTVTGHGSVPIQQCINIVKQAGYDAYVSVEFEGWEDNLQALKSAYAFMRKII